MSDNAMILRSERLRRALKDYPWDAIFFAMMVVLVVIVLGSFAIDALWEGHWLAEGRQTAAAFRGTCYWMGDSRTLVRIARSGYSDYGLMPNSRHLTNLPDRSWWPAHVNLIALALNLTGGSYCSGWWVNLAAMVLLVPVIQGLTGTRRPSLLVGVTLLPFGVWMYSGMAEGTFLLLSGLLLWVCLRRPTTRWRTNLLWGVAGLLLGVLTGLTKPNTIALLPGFAVLALSRTAAHLRATAGVGSRWRRALDDANPAWTALLGTVGMAVGWGVWMYQSSGYYPLYVLLAQRTLWFREFNGGDVLAFLEHITLGWRFFLQTGDVPYPYTWLLIEFAAIALMGILVARDLPPRWPGAAQPRPTPPHAAASLLSVLVLMFLSGQSHAIERYFIGNIFFVVAFLRYVYGDEDEPPLVALPRLAWARGPGSLRAALRLAVFACGLVLLGAEALLLTQQAI